MYFTYVLISETTGKRYIGQTIKRKGESSARHWSAQLASLGTVAIWRSVLKPNTGEASGTQMLTVPPRPGVTPKKKADAPIGKWNRFIITMKGDHLSVNLNGETVLENAQLPGVPQRGPIALQHHGDAIEFANIFIKQLE